MESSMRVRHVCGCAVLATFVVFGCADGANAQTTVVLNQPLTQVTDTTIRGGSHAATNYAGQDLATKSYTDASYVRHAIVKFDTENTIPLGTAVTAATLTVTVASGGTDA